ncbi:MAG TPA: hypothetical protein VIM41_06480 [Gammaproteobacteria bacterium]
MRNEMQKTAFFILLFIAGIFNLAACESSKQSQRAAAPLGDKAALEKLAAAYETAAKPIPTSPMQLRPEARKRFVEQVFRDAGYDYFATLQALSKVAPESVTQYHKDIKQLLFLPHYGTVFEETKSIYNEQETQALQTIDSIVK